MSLVEGRILYMTTCNRYGLVGHAGGWFTTSPEELVREQKAREAASVFTPTVRRRGGRIQKIQTIPAAGGSQGKTKRSE